MASISNTIELLSGTPQFRIQEALGDTAPTFIYYGQPEIEDDLTGLDSQRGSRKQVRTFDKVSTVKTGDAVFSLISGKAAIVRESHSGFLFTQNYVKLVPSSAIDARYLVYMLNEGNTIRRQLQSGQQGSVILKYTIRQLSDLVFPNPPPMERQRIIGELYFNQLRLSALKSRVAESETNYLIAKLKEACAS